MFSILCFILCQWAGGHLSAPAPPETPVTTAKNLPVESTAEKQQEPEETKRKTGYGATTPQTLLSITTGVVTEATIAARVGASLHQVLAGSVAGLTISATNDLSGGYASFAMRMPPSWGGSNQPLYVLDGVPLVDSQDGRRLADLIPADIASIEVLKGPSASAIYGVHGAFGVILIDTRRGEEGKPKFSVRQSLGTSSASKRLGVRRFTRESAIATYGENVGSTWQADFFDHEAAIYEDDAAALETLFSVHGGTGRTRYYLSASSLGKNGIVAGTNYDRDSLRLNLDHQLTDRIALGLNLGFSKISEPADFETLNQDLLTTLAFTPSFYDLTPDAAGNYPHNPFISSNPYSLRDNRAYINRVDRNTASLKFSYQILNTSQNTLDLDLVLGLDDALAKSSFDFLSSSYGFTTSMREEHRNESAHFVLTHQRSLGGNHLRSRVGIQYDTTERKESTSTDLTGQSRSTRSTATSRERGFFVEEALTGPWYFLSGGVRSDSYSRNNRDYGKLYYPWLNGSLRLSQLDFWTPMKAWLPEFKLRAAWGSSRAIGRSLYAPGTENEPDKHREWDIGLDAAFWSGRGALTLSFFNRKVEDSDLLQRNPSGSNYTVINNARHMSIEGWEASLSLTPMKGENWHWLARLDYYSLEARVTHLKVAPFNLRGTSLSLGGYHIEEGWSPTSIIGSNYDATAQLVKLGDVTPDYQLTWHNELQRSAWSLNWLLDIRQGGEAIDLTRLLTDLGGTSPDLDENPNRIEAWMNGDTRPWVHDSSYMRLREVRLAYNMSPSRLHGKLGHWLSSVEFALAGRNLKTWSNFEGYDPEQGSFGIGSENGINYPTAKSAYLSVTLGLPAGR